jgi:transcriptional regulator GlxA family with amidase domain
MRVHVLVLEDVFDLGLSAVLDAFRTANELAEMSGFSGERFEVKIVSVMKSVRTSQGLTVPVQAIGSKAPFTAISTAPRATTAVEISFMILLFWVTIRRSNQLNYAPA